MTKFLIILPALIFIAANALTVQLSKRRFGACMPLTMSLSVLFLYFSQLAAKSFQWGYWLILAWAAAGCVSFAVNIRKQAFRSRFLTNGLIIFTMMAAAFTVIDAGNSSLCWDETSHWAQCVREMLRLDRFYTVPEARFLFPENKDYPPFISLWEMLWCRFSGSWSAGAALMSVHLFNCSMFILPLLETLPDRRQGAFRRCAYCAAALLLGLLTMLLMDADSFDHFMPDMTMPVMMAWLMLLILQKDTFQTALLVGLFSLPLLKQISIGFALMVSMLYVLAEFSSFIIQKDRKVSAQVIAKAIVVCLLPLISWGLWHLHISASSIPAHWYTASSDKASPLMVLLGRGNAIQQICLQKYAAAIFKNDLSRSIFSVSHVSILVLLCASLILLYRKKRIREIIPLGITFVSGWLVYTAAILFLYLSIFSDNDMLGLGCYSRYMVSFDIGVFMVIAGLAFTLYVQEAGAPTLKQLAAALAVITLLGSYDTWASFVPRSFIVERNIFQETEAHWLEDQVEEGSRVLILSSDYGGTAVTVLYATEALNASYMDFRRMEEANDFTWEETLADKLAEADYCFVTKDILPVYSEWLNTHGLSAGVLCRVDQNGQIAEPTAVME